MKRRKRLYPTALAVPFFLLACGDAPVVGPPSDDRPIGVPEPVFSVGPGAGTVTTWDLQTEWSDTDNPNGVWSVNAGDTPLEPVADLSTTEIDGFSTTQPGFTGQPIFGDITPVWFQAAGSMPDYDTDWEVGDIVTHTSRSFVPNSNVRWTSPVSGRIDISGNVWATRKLERTNEWFVYLNAELLTSGTVFDGDPYDRDNPLPLSGGTGGAVPLQSVTVVPGDIVKLEFKEADCEDYVGVNLTITLASPTSKDDCKMGGWALYGFRNQGLCIRFVQAGEDSR